MKRVDKKGLSPVVASVLLIVFVIVLGLIVFLWARGFIAEQIMKKGQPIDDFCNNVRFDAELIYNVGDAAWELQIVNRGDVDINSFEIKERDVDGNSYVHDFEFSVYSGDAKEEFVRLKGPDTVTIYPALLGEGENENKIYVCEDGETLKVRGSETLGETGSG